MTGAEAADCRASFDAASALSRETAPGTGADSTTESTLLVLKPNAVNFLCAGSTTAIFLFLGVGIKLLHLALLNGDLANRASGLRNSLVNMSFGHLLVQLSPILKYRVALSPNSQPGLKRLHPEPLLTLLCLLTGPSGWMLT